MRAHRSGCSPVRGLAAAILAVALIVPGIRVTAQDNSLEGLPEVEGWALSSAMLVPRSEQSVTAHDGKIWLLGGYPGDRIPSDVVQIYDTATRRWEMGPS